MRGAARPPWGAWGERPPVGGDAVSILQKLLKSVAPISRSYRATLSPVGMSERHCPFCFQPFQPSRCHPQQAVCSRPACQQRRRAANRKQKLMADPEYRQVCRDSARKWRDQHRDYWRQYRAAHPQAVERNCTQQRQRDQRRRLLDLANNNSALNLKSTVAGVWLLGPAAQDLANNNLATAQVFILSGPGRKPPATEASCKQHLSGVTAALA